MPSTRPIYTQNSLSNFLQVNSSELGLQLGRSYVWRDKISDDDQRVLYKNNGYSNICWFEVEATNEDAFFDSIEIADFKVGTWGPRKGYAKDYIDLDNNGVKDLNGNYPSFLYRYRGADSHDPKDWSLAPPTGEKRNV